MAIFASCISSERRTAHFRKYVASPTSQIKNLVRKQFSDTSKVSCYSFQYDASSFRILRKHDYAFYKNSVLLLMLLGFADVPVISETIVDTGCDVVDGSADTVDELISTSTAKLYTLPFACAL